MIFKKMTLNRRFIVACLFVIVVCVAVVCGFSKPATTSTKASTCCLPPVHSYKGTFYQKSLQEENNQPDSVTVMYNVDMKSFRKREVVVIKSNQTELVYSTLKLKMDDVTIEYRIKPTKCSCSKSKNYQWKETCIEATSENTTPYTIGKNSGFITMIDKNGGKYEYTTLREPNMEMNTCWMLSKTMYFDNSVQDYKYYDMIEYVEDSDFEIPENCPPIDECYH